MFMTAASCIHQIEIFGIQRIDILSLTNFIPFHTSANQWIFCVLQMDTKIFLRFYWKLIGWAKYRDSQYLLLVDQYTFSIITSWSSHDSRERGWVPGHGIIRDVLLLSKGLSFFNAEKSRYFAIIEFNVSMFKVTRHSFLKIGKFAI
jgi:hypothetical protein